MPHLQASIFMGRGAGERPDGLVRKRGPGPRSRARGVLQSVEALNRVFAADYHNLLGRPFRQEDEAGWLARNDPDTETMGRELQLPPRSPAMV